VIAVLAAMGFASLMFARGPPMHELGPGDSSMWAMTADADWTSEIAHE
jgi:hypothetical protein